MAKACRADLALVVAAATAAALLYPDSEPSGNALMHPTAATASVTPSGNDSRTRVLHPQPVAAGTYAPLIPAAAGMALLTEPLEHASGDDDELSYEFREDEGLLRRVLSIPDGATFASPFGAQAWGTALK